MFNGVFQLISSDDWNYLSIIDEWAGQICEGELIQTDFRFWTHIKKQNETDKKLQRNLATAKLI